MKTKKEKKAAKKAMKPAKETQFRFKPARSPIAEGARLYALAERPSKADFVKVYGPKAPSMTWAQRAKAGVDTRHLQAARAEKSKA
jgi:hypothetical protein